jgi:transcriptional regulator, ArgP family
MGTPLVLRGTPARGTDTGRRLARHMEEVGLLEAQLAHDLGQSGGPATPVPLAVNADSLATWFTAAMAGAGEMLFQLTLDDQDHSADWLKRGEVMAAVSARDRPVPGCDLHPLGALRYYAVATPEFATRHFPEGIKAEALSQAPSLLFNEKDRLQDNWVMAQTGRKFPLPTHRIPSTHGFVDAALSGLGWGLNPEVLLTPHLEAGRLITLAPEPVDIALYWHISRLSAPVLAPLTASVKHAARAALIP